MRTAILAGATGLVGSACLRLLLRDPTYDRVVALVRHPLAETDPKLEIRVTDFEQLGGIDLPAGADIFCALGTTIRKAGSQAAFRQVDYEYPRALALRGAAFDARQFALISSVGANADSGTFYLRIKGETERAIASLPFHAVHIFRPGILTGTRAESRPAERVGIAFTRLFEFALTGALRKYRAMPADLLATAMVAAARQAQAGAHIYHYDEIRALAAS